MPQIVLAKPHKNQPQPKFLFNEEKSVKISMPTKYTKTRTDALLTTLNLAQTHGKYMGSIHLNPQQNMH
jgi:hypothetical protein